VLLLFPCEFAVLDFYDFCCTVVRINESFADFNVHVEVFPFRNHDFTTD
jgi:hypothetical protein